MKHIYIFLFFLSSVSVFAQFTLDANRLTITANVMGDQLRTFVIANPASGTVVNNDIEFNVHLRVNANQSLTDNNAVYHFTGDHRFEPRNNCTVTFTDVMIHYSGTAKSHSSNQQYTANYTRLFYLQGVTSGRSDFFNNGDYTFNMSDVTLVSYGDSDFLHFQTAETLNNITIVNAQGGLNFEPGARNAGEVETINNLKLIGVTRMVGGSGSNGDFKTYDMDWDATNWNFSKRNVDFFFVNPIKPAGWTTYSGGSTLNVKEYYTHDVSITDEDLIPLQNITTLLFNNADNLFDYNLDTDALGQLPTQEILKIDNAVTLNFDRGISTLIIAEYLREYTALQREFDKALTDNLISRPDNNISETTEAIVAAYAGISIDHSAKTLTISQNHTLCEVYDYIKLNKLTNLRSPTVDDLFINVSGSVIDINDYQFILSGSAVISPCDKFTKIESTEASILADVDNLDVGLEDANGLYKLLSFLNVSSADAILTDENTSTTLSTETNYTGDINFVTQLNSTDVKMLVTRDGYTSWSANIDVSGTQDVFVFQVYQAISPNAATVENQDDIIFLAKKILMKNEGVLKELKGTNPTLNINNITQPATINATEERQEEALTLLKRILNKTTAIKKSL